MQDNKMLVKVIMLLFMAWFLYSLLPYVIAALSVFLVVLFFARLQNR